MCSRGKTAITELLKPCLRERRAYHVTAQAVCNSLAVEADALLFFLRCLSELQLIILSCYACCLVFAIELYSNHLFKWLKIFALDFCIDIF